MANFGDELRNAPAEEERRRREQASAELREWSEKRKARHRGIVADTVKAFQDACRAAAAQGKRSIDFKPDSSRGPMYSLLMANTVTDLLFASSARKEAREEILPMLTAELAAMGLRSYHVTLHEFNSTYPTRRYVGFHIKATW